MSYISLVTDKEIISHRLTNQLITANHPHTPAEVVATMGALQAQDYGMVKWAVGLRMEKGTQETVEKALDQGQILRTHVLRPTWHLVHPDDIRWMLALTGPRIIARMAPAERKMGLTKDILAHSQKIIEKVLTKEHRLSRPDLTARLEKAKIPTHEHLLLHILMHAELNGLICSGPRQGKQFTYELLDRRVAPAKKLSRDESLAELSRRYFNSHGPATLYDFAWWSGLSVTEAKKGIAMNSAHLQNFVIGDKTYWLAGASQTPSKRSSHPAKPSSPPAKHRGILLLPAFDELIIGYADRSALLAPDMEQHVFTKNGIFRPVILVNGKWVGIWSRSEKKDKVLVERQLIHPVGASSEKAMMTACKKYGEFIGKEL
jgi:hypothetical protein